MAARLPKVRHVAMHDGGEAHKRARKPPPYILCSVLKSRSACSYTVNDVGVDDHGARGGHAKPFPQPALRQRLTRRASLRNLTRAQRSTGKVSAKLANPQPRPTQTSCTTLGLCGTCQNKRSAPLSRAPSSCRTRELLFEHAKPYALVRLPANGERVDEPCLRSHGQAGEPAAQYVVVPAACSASCTGNTSVLNPTLDTNGYLTPW